MQLLKKNLKKIIPQAGFDIPGDQLFKLPEKVLQFGTGVLLRGLPDYFIDKANKQGFFNGRIVVVKSTAKGGIDAFEKQDGLYTLCIKGVEEGKTIEETIINNAINRVLSAGEEWEAVLQCAHNPAMQLIISNTTEVGIALTDDDIRLSPPGSFPGKLLAFLYERYKAFNGSEESGMVIVPTELITDNGDKLRNIVLQLAEKNNLEASFIEWLKSVNHFCNSLVDRIVPGKLPVSEQKLTEEKLGYSDELMIMAEPFRLWVIQANNEKIKSILSFSRVDEGVVITPDIEKFRELKLRLLNGPHTFCCALAVLAGFETVKDAMNDDQMSAFIKKLMMTEIAMSMDDSLVSYSESCTFANKVLDRFRNPFLEHKWLSIALNYTSKMRMRNIPLLVRYFDKTGKSPQCMALGFAAYILFMKCHKEDDRFFYGEINGRKYLIEDESAGYFAEQWATENIDKLVDGILSVKELWGVDLSVLNGWARSVKDYIHIIQKEGALTVLKNMEL